MSAKTEKLSITIPKEVAEMLREYVPSGKISSYVAEVLESQLLWERQKRALEKYAGAWKDEDHPDLKTPEDTQRFIREIRDRDIERLERLRKLWDEE
ncbi:MAG: hypothetical protein Q8O43_01060 [Dehalococcoidia bacterium]|nr:hypothetical protein [Dehalococcoidia bacterium]